MHADTTISIPLSRDRLLFFVIASAVFVGIGCWMMLDMESLFAFDSIYLRIPAVAAILFFGYILFHATRKILDTTPGLVIGPDGIIDNSSATSVGFIPWSQVSDLTTTSVESQRFVTVHLADDGPYLARGSRIVRLMNRANTRMTGSPINISSSSLKISFEELEKTLRHYFERYGSRS